MSARICLARGEAKHKNLCLFFDVIYCMAVNRQELESNEDGNVDFTLGNKSLFIRMKDRKSDDVMI